MVRKIGAVVAGVLVVGVIVTVLQLISATLYPVPEGIDPLNPDDADAFAAYLSSLPVTGWAIASFSELLGGFLGAVAAGWIARDQARGFSGAIVGLALVGSIINWTSFTHPTWFIVSQLVGYPIALMGAWTLLARRAPAPEL